MLLRLAGRLQRYGEAEAQMLNVAKVLLAESELIDQAAGELEKLK